MFGKRITIAAIKGFELKVQYVTLLFLGVLLLLLVYGIFPYSFSSLSSVTYWWMGLSVLVGVLVSIAFHEYVHLLVYCLLGVRVNSVTLFLFGGVRECENDSLSWEKEIVASLSGPLASTIFAFCFYILVLLTTEMMWSIPINGVVLFLFYYNLLLVGLNLLPFFPLDGGFLVRLFFHYVTKNIRKASMISNAMTTVGSMLFITIGMAFLLGGSFVGGLWWVIFGISMIHASELAVQKYINRLQIEDISELSEKVRTKVIGGTVSIQNFVTDCLCRESCQVFPVEKEGMLVGQIGHRDVMRVPEKRWTEISVGEVASAGSKNYFYYEHCSFIDLLRGCFQSGATSFHIIDKSGFFKGTVTLNDILATIVSQFSLDENN
ncbi:hypothetical protein QA601_10245 [Chitinispirillales bacterium ANBcel5]|uniref:site-2 protease family protein n=1 Tax=Cellulosispirillum alkaliphilum TaxID=3039283 RepID=UPI002A53F866|nr:hypothetical protein [Chitinispirillales bacterium ANBcel5]